MTSTDTKIIPVERTLTSMWSDHDRIRDVDVFSRDLKDIDHHWRQMDEWMDKVWREHPWSDLHSRDFFGPSRTFSEAMTRMRNEIDRLWSESGMRDMTERRDILDWHGELASIMDKDRFAVNLDVHGFKPEDLKVTVSDDLLTIEGKHEEKSNDGVSRFVSRQFIRKYALPQDVDPERVQSFFSDSGKTLKIEAPRQGGIQGKTVPILRSSSKIQEIEDRRSNTPTRKP